MINKYKKRNYKKPIIINIECDNKKIHKQYKLKNKKKNKNIYKNFIMEFLDFEVPVKEVLDQIDKCKSIENESDVDVTKTFNLLQKKLVETKNVKAIPIIKPT